MTQLPQFTWDVDPVFIRVPRELVIGGLAVFAAISLFVGLRKKAGDQLLTAVIFGALGIKTETGIASALCDAIPGTIFSGTSEIQRDLIARGLGL